MMMRQDTDPSEAHDACSCLMTDYPVSFAIFALARSHRARAASLLTEIGLFPGQEILLMRLGEQDGQAQKTLCDSLGLDHSTIAKSLTRLERCGLIERRKCNEDGRVSQAYLTPKGREARQAIAAVWGELERLTVADLTPAEQAQLIAIARKITPGLEQ
jgi:DNA-binding MarR family transcriptional regulator